MFYKTLHRELKIEQHEPHYKQTTNYKTLHRKLKIEQHEPHYKPGFNSAEAAGYVVPAPLIIFVVLRFNHSNIL